MGRFKTTQIPFRVAEREAGESKWSTKSLIKYAILNITSFFCTYADCHYLWFHHVTYLCSIWY